MAFDPPLTVEEVAHALGDKFDVLAAIATGGQGAVFKAQALSAPGDSSSSALVALKIYFEEQVEERTAREIAAMRTIRGDALVRLFDEGRCEVRGARCIYIATSFIEGETLARVIARGPVAADLVARVGHDIAQAIQEMWSHRLVHRDIKPNNIMMNQTGRAVLIDLGLARHLDLSPITTAGKAWGTEGYYSPEHARAQALTCKSDIFALGIVMQECLLGRHPTARRQLALMQGGPRTGALRPGLPPTLVTLVDAMVHASAVYRPMPELVTSTLRPLAGI